MRSLRASLIVAALVLTGLAAGCQRKPASMRNMTLTTERTQDTRPISASPHVADKYKGAGEPEVSPAPPPGPKPGQPAR